MSHESNVCNGPLVTGMYTVRPYFDSNMPVELPRCMYSLRGVYGNQVTATTQALNNVTDVVSA